MFISEGKADHEAKNPLDESTVALTMDMSQNGTVPTLGADQPGDLYYLSPKTEYIFGVCNNATNFMNVLYGVKKLPTEELIIWCHVYIGTWLGKESLMVVQK